MATDEQEKPIQEVLSFPILLSDRIRTAADDAGTFTADCADVAKQVDRIAHMLRSTVRFAASSLYERPVRRILAEVSRTLGRSLKLVKRCKRRRGLLLCLGRVARSDFRKLHGLLEASAADMRWLLGILDRDSGIVLSLPPIASTDPILSFVWSFVAALHCGEPGDRIEAASELSSLARDNDRNRQIIVDEGGVPPLLNLLKEGSFPDAQIAAANALFEVADSWDRVRLMGKEQGIFSVVVQVLGKSPMRVQIRVANLISRMAGLDPESQEDFARENVIRPLVTLLSFETFVDGEERNPTLGIHSVGRHLSWSWSFCSDGSNGNYRKERENEDPEVKHKLKIACAEALWMVAKGSVLNSRRITETKGLLCLAKLVEKSQGELQFNCLMAIMEITTAAELSVDLRRAAFRNNSPAAKAVVDQLLRLIKEFDSPSLQIPSIKSIGSLARTFPARETRTIALLVERLCHANQDVATEAAISLGKFACPENFLCVQHSKTIIEFNGVPPLMRLLRAGERAQLHALILLCYLAMHAGNTEDLEQARVLIALEGVDPTVVPQNHELRELVPKAIYHLNLYQASVHPQRQPYAP
ncbi:hypothetical protein C3L33_13982, partial [Rhododendron williamsianum]